MKTLEEHNEEVLRKNLLKDHTNIECPTCKEELRFKDETIYLSNPPQRDVLCFNCGFRTRVYA